MLPKNLNGRSSKTVIPLYTAGDEFQRFSSTTFEVTFERQLVNNHWVKTSASDAVKSLLVKNTGIAKLNSEFSRKSFDFLMLLRDSKLQRQLLCVRIEVLP